MNRIRAAGAMVAAAGLAIGLSACGSGFGGDGAEQDESAPLSILIGSSGDAETAAVESAVADWSEDSGIDAEVTAASDLNQQLAQGFSSGNPPDVFYMSADQFASYAENGSLQSYAGDLPNADDFYPALVDSFTFDGEFYCAPKDFSTLQLIINTDLWTAAGLTDDDIPTNWDELTAVATTLTSGPTTGLVMSGEYARVGAFMVQAGGNLMNEDSTEATADTPENLEALEYVKQNLTSGVFKYAADVGAGWGGEAFGKQLGAMTIEGNWITGAMTNDFPEVNYQVVELPEGPAGKGTLAFTNCWGVAADSGNVEGALDLVEKLTSTDDQLAFSEAFGVMPSIESAADQWSSDNAELEPFLLGAEYAKGVPTAPGAADVVTDFNSQVSQLVSGDPQQILSTTQANLEAILE
jgi:multiple sugar transport system substrate-binding protein